MQIELLSSHKNFVPEMNRTRICLTVPSQKIGNTNDNIEKNLVVYKGDKLRMSDNLDYLVIDKLGHGTFGQVFRCVSNYGDEVAIKVVKNEITYYQYELHEIRILKMLKEQGLNESFVEILDGFIFNGHLCIVLELLNRSILDMLKITNYFGLPTNMFRTICEQILNSLDLLHRRQITHGDVKPENILLTNGLEQNVKIIDFSSAHTKTVSTVFYAQSRYYRAPEVILGIPYTNMVDLWSFGCIAYEMISGEPLFPGRDNSDQICRIFNFFSGKFPNIMLEHGTATAKYFNKIDGNFIPKAQSPKFTVDDMVSKIYEKVSNSVEAELLADMILSSINPFYLKRSQACSLLQHQYFQSKPIFKTAISRHLSTNKDLGLLKYRKGSIYECDYEINANLGEVRKKSHFDFYSSKENSANFK